MDNKVIQQIKDIKFPSTNVYYEQDSADGFAFLGYARLRYKFDALSCYQEMCKRNFRLNANRTISHTKAKVSKDNHYIYTIWACLEFLIELKASNEIEFLMGIVDKIGTYSQGLTRYCIEEMYYVVPNVTSAMALLYAYQGRQEETGRLLGVLAEYQTEEGNWYYRDSRTWKTYPKQEDSYHLAMMIYHLRKIRQLIHIDKISIDKMINKTMELLKKMNKNKLSPGSIGWGIPMLMVASKGLDDDLYKRSYDQTCKESLQHENFRVRGISAWALVQAETL